MIYSVLLSDTVPASKLDLIYYCMVIGYLDVTQVMSVIYQYAGVYRLILVYELQQYNEYTVSNQSYYRP